MVHPSPDGVILNDMDIFICHWIDQAEGGEAFLFLFLLP